MSKTLMIHHVVFCTKHRKPTINMNSKKKLYSVMYNILKTNKCWVYRINGMHNHVHILFDLHPTVAMADLIKTLKVSTNNYLTGNPDFLTFEGWGVGYFAVSVSPGDLEPVKNYIIMQQVHHAQNDFLMEIEDLIHNNGMQWHNDDWD